MDDVSRYQFFCQFRSIVRGSKQHLIVGIDVGKDQHHGFFGTATGNTLWRKLVFNNDLAGYLRLVEQVEMLMAQHRLEKVVFGLEPTGNYHKPLANWLLDKGYHLVLVTGQAVSDNRQLLDGRWDKNDTKDSANVADLISQGKCRFFEQPDAHIVSLRNLLSVRKQLKKQEHRLRMQIRNGLLAKYFPEMDKFWANSLDENLSIVRWYLDPQKIADTDFDRFVGHVTSKKRSDKQMRRLHSIYAAAKHSVGLPVDPSAMFEATVLVERFYEVRKQIAHTMKQIEHRCRDMNAYRLLLTIPGFGPYISALVLAAIGNPHRFPSHKQVLRLAGLDLNANRSGKNSDARVPKISKRGDGDLRYGLFQAAMIASNRNQGFRSLYKRILEGRSAERGIKTKARVKLSAKMLTVAWAMLKNNEPFNVDRLMVQSR